MGNYRFRSTFILVVVLSCVMPTPSSVYGHGDYQGLWRQVCGGRGAFISKLKESLGEDAVTSVFCNDLPERVHRASRIPVRNQVVVINLEASRPRHYTLPNVIVYVMPREEVRRLVNYIPIVYRKSRAADSDIEIIPARSYEYSF